MRAYYPKSFLKLILAGFALAGLPLVLALVTATIYVDRIATKSQRAVYQAVQATQASRMIVEQIATMERYARQYQVLGEEALFEGYTKAHLAFEETAIALVGLPLDRTLRRDLEQLIDREIRIYSALNVHQRKAERVTEAIAEFESMSDVARAILEGSNRLVDRESNQMRKDAERARTVLLWQAFSVIPTAIILALGFVVLLSRPIKQIDEAIRHIGSGGTVDPIQVGGPQDLQRLGERLEWLRLRLAELEQQKARFLRQVSHELKTPLTALREGTELLADGVVGTLAEKQREVVHILQRNCAQLQKLIEDLLKYNEDRLRPSHHLARSFDLRDVLRRVLTDHKLTLMSKHIRLEARIDPDPCYGDEESVRVILDNLLSNAAKFSREGTVISVTGVRESGQWMLQVCDQGPGVAAEERERIFEPLYRGRAASMSNARGTGLGLAIVKEYVSMLGGTVFVVEADTGACFRVLWPEVPQVERTNEEELV